MNSIQIILIWLSFVGYYQTIKPLPDGVNYSSRILNVSPADIIFLNDLTYIDSDSNYVHDQEIFESLIALIDGAEHYILIDAFLFNSYKGPVDSSYRELSSELAQKLIKKKTDFPGIKIDFITDPINTFYGGSKIENLESIEAAGINVIYADLKKLRDSTPLYSPIWRTFIQWFGNSDKYGLFPHPFSKHEQKVTLRSYFSFFNLKANHRKVALADNEGKIISIVTSANPHSASSAFSNVAVKIEGEFWKEIYATEKLIAAFSNDSLQGDFLFEMTSETQPAEGNTSIQFLTEKQVKDNLMINLAEAGAGDSISIAMFYFSNRDIIKTLLKAAERGVDIRLIIDPNKDAFGYPRNGLPNRPVANEFVKKSKGKIKIRWYHTHGEQFHTKLILIKKDSGQAVIMLGSTNLTRKNLENYNLESEVLIKTPTASELTRDITNYFDKIWFNHDGNFYTADYEKFKDDSIFKTIIYRIQEFSGLSTY